MPGGWKGEEVIKKLQEAAKLGIDRTTTPAVVQAKNNHPWQNVTGTAEGSIRMKPAEIQPDGVIRGQFGSYGVHYFIFLELGTTRTSARPCLRPAYDAETPKLAERIQEAFDEL